MAVVGSEESSPSTSQEKELLSLIELRLLVISTLQVRNNGAAS